MKLMEIIEDIKDFSNSKSKILVGKKTNLINDMKRKYKTKKDKSGNTCFFDKGEHFATLYDEDSEFPEIKHDETLKGNGRRIK